MLEFMGTDPIEFGTPCLPYSARLANYRIRMAETDPRRILWANVQALMKRDEISEAETVRRAGFTSGANMTRVKAMETDVSLLVLRGFAAAFKVPVWQLLAPDLGVGLYTFEGKTLRPVYDGTPTKPQPGKEEHKGGAGGDLHRSKKQKQDRQDEGGHRKEH